MKRPIIGTVYGASWEKQSELTFFCHSIKEAVQHCLYYLRLSDGRAKVGPTGRVVYGNGKRIVFSGSEQGSIYGRNLR